MWAVHLFLAAHRAERAGPTSAAARVLVRDFWAATPCAWGMSSAKTPHGNALAQCLRDHVRRLPAVPNFRDVNALRAYTQHVLTSAGLRTRDVANYGRLLLKLVVERWPAFGGAAVLLRAADRQTRAIACREFEKRLTADPYSFYVRTRDLPGLQPKTSPTGGGGGGG